MTAETATTPFPLHPEWEATLAANPALRYLWDGSPARPVTATEAARYEDRRSNPEWQWLYDLTARGQALPPVAAEVTEPAEPVVPGENAGGGGGELGGSVLTVTTVKTTAAAGIAAVEDAADAGDIAIAHAGALALVVAAAADESAGLVLTEDGRDDPSAAAEGATAWSYEPTERDKQIARDDAAPVVAAELDAGREAAMERFNEAHDAEAAPAESAVIPAVEDFTQANPKVTDGTEGDGQA